MKYKQPSGYAPGIYFGLHEDDYHRDKALSHSGITDILVSEMDYWENSPLNPHKKHKDSPAMAFGKQCHMMLLEEKKFFETYNIAGGRWEKSKAGCTLTSSEFQLIKESAQIIKRDPDTAAYFQNGYPEVSIFVTDPATGIRLRIRVDYLRTFGCVDLKRLRSIQKKKLGYDIISYGYDIQDYLYRYVVGLAKQQLRAGKIKAYGDYDPAWLKAFMDDEDTMFVFFVQRSVRPYIYRIWHFDEHIRAEAKIITERGIQRYKHAIETYGETGWPDGSAKPGQFTIDDLPRRSLDD